MSPLQKVKTVLLSEFLYYMSGAAPEANLKKQFFTLHNCSAAYKSQAIHYASIQKQERKNRSTTSFHLSL